jgi:hypothetical protein
MSVDGISVGSSMWFVRGVVRIDVIGNCTDNKIQQYTEMMEK